MDASRFTHAWDDDTVYDDERPRCVRPDHLARGVVERLLYEKCSLVL